MESLHHTLLKIEKTLLVIQKECIYSINYYWNGESYFPFCFNTNQIGAWVTVSFFVSKYFLMIRMFGSRIGAVRISKLTQVIFDLLIVFIEFLDKYVGIACTALWKIRDHCKVSFHSLVIHKVMNLISPKRHLLHFILFQFWNYILSSLELNLK